MTSGLEMEKILFLLIHGAMQGWDVRQISCVVDWVGASAVEV